MNKNKKSTLQQEDNVPAYILKEYELNIDLYKHEDNGRMDRLKFFFSMEAGAVL